MTSLFDVVVPTIGRPSLGRLLGALAAQSVPFQGRIIVVDDRADGRPVDASLAGAVEVLGSHARSGSGACSRTPPARGTSSE